MKILLPVDGSDYTKRMLAYLSAHDELLAGDHEYLLFTAIEPTASHDADFVKGASMDMFMRELAEQVLRPVQAFAKQQGWKCEIDFVPGPAAAAIVAKAETWQPDLIVMGTRGRSPFATFVLGSVANGVLANCKVPVLLIR